MNDRLQHLLSAYRQTEYCVPDLGVRLRIGQACPVLDEWLERHGAATAVFITACNPLSQERSDAENTQLNEILLKRISSEYQVHFGMGSGLDGQWPPEASFLVLDMGRECANALADEFCQLAYVLYEHGRAELILRPEQARQLPLEK